MQTFSPKIAGRPAGFDTRRVLDLVKDEMDLVEEELKRQAASAVPVIHFLGRYLRASGGKRIRPAMLLLAYRASGGKVASANVIRMAAVMEMIHTATLVHDDIIDNAVTRRSRTTVNAKFGNQAAVLMGDWLYMSAFETALGERSLEILDILTGLTRKMTEGELIQLTMLGRTDIGEREYFDILKRKTAYLFSACCEIGSILAGAALGHRTAMAEFGLNLGTAFQLADDLLDFTAEDEVLGKASGADLLEGKLTLPLILLLKKEPSLKTRLEKIMRDGGYREGARTLLLKDLRSSGSLEETRRVALDRASDARKNLEILPETRYRVALEGVPALVIERNH